MYSDVLLVAARYIHFIYYHDRVVRGRGNSMGNKNLIHIVLSKEAHKNINKALLISG